MAIRLGSNPLSLGLQSSLNKTDTTLSKTTERLSSGLRINRGSDDAAGLAISQSLNINTKVYSQGVRNLNDGLSAINVADGAIDGLNTILSRIEELAMQAANGAVSDTQRSVMQQEVTALQAEWNRIVDTTTFNGQQLLTGSTTRMVLQGGPKAAGALGVQVGKEALATGFDNYAGGLSMVNTSSAGVQGASFFYRNGLSADGRFVAFESEASNLVSGDVSNWLDVFLKDSLTGVTTRVSTSSAGAEANGHSYFGGISADGRYVAFYSYASNLVTGDTNGARDAFVKDTFTGVTTRVSTSSAGVEGNGAAYDVVISADGRYVAFTSTSSNLVAGDTNNRPDAFVKDTLTGAVSRVSTSSSGTQSVGGLLTKVGAISADGRYVAFSSTASNLVSGDTNNRVDAFVKDTRTGATTRINTSSAGAEAYSYVGYTGTVTAISADGRYVAFWSDADNLVANDTNGAIDSFVKDTATGLTTRISTSSTGQQGNYDSKVTSMSADGRYVLFTSYANNLVVNDTNIWDDAFVKDTVTGVTTRVSTSASGQQANYYSFAGSISADGRYVTFGSPASNLLAGDTGGAIDIFRRDLTKAGIQTLAGMVVNNTASATVTMSLVQNYRNELIEYRGKLGASSSRLLSYISALDDNRVNLATASSRITDADIASESATLIAANTRRQVTSSLLAQANLAPEIALALLRNL